MDKIALFMSAVGSGLISTMQVFQMPDTVQRHPRSDLDALRSDWVRVGNTMCDVIHREMNGKAAQDASRTKQ
jgi:hypothetical protein